MEHKGVLCKHEVIIADVCREDQGRLVENCSTNNNSAAQVAAATSTKTKTAADENVLKQNNNTMVEVMTVKPDIDFYLHNDDDYDDEMHKQTVEEPVQISTTEQEHVTNSSGYSSSIQEESVRAVTCIYCNSNQDSLENMFHHLRIHLDLVTEPAKAEMEMGFMCLYRRNSSKTDLLCLLCGKVLVNWESIKIHLKGHVLKEGFYYCNICEKVFTQEAKFGLHLENEHPNQNKNKCYSCLFEFPNLRLLSAHHAVCKSTRRRADRPPPKLLSIHEREIKVSGQAEDNGMSACGLASLVGDSYGNETHDSIMPSEEQFHDVSTKQNAWQPPLLPFNKPLILPKERYPAEHQDQDTMNASNMAQNPGKKLAVRPLLARKAVIKKCPQDAQRTAQPPQILNKNDRFGLFQVSRSTRTGLTSNIFLLPKPEVSTSSGSQNLKVLNYINHPQQHSNIRLLNLPTTPQRSEPQRETLCLPSTSNLIFNTPRASSSAGFSQRISTTGMRSRNTTVEPLPGILSDRFQSGISRVGSPSESSSNGLHGSVSSAKSTPALSSGGYFPIIYSGSSIPAMTQRRITPVIPTGRVIPVNSSESSLSTFSPGRSFPVISPERSLPHVSAECSPSIINPGRSLFGISPGRSLPHVSAESYQSIINPGRSLSAISPGRSLPHVSAERSHPVISEERSFSGVTGIGSMSGFSNVGRLAEKNPIIRSTLGISDGKSYSDFNLGKIPSHIKNNGQVSDFTCRSNYAGRESQPLFFPDGPGPSSSGLFVSKSQEDNQPKVQNFAASCNFNDPNSTPKSIKIEARSQVSPNKIRRKDLLDPVQSSNASGALKDEIHGMSSMGSNFATVPTLPYSVFMQKSHQFIQEPDLQMTASCKSWNQQEPACFPEAVKIEQVQHRHANDSGFQGNQKLKHLKKNSAKMMNRLPEQGIKIHKCGRLGKDMFVCDDCGKHFIRPRNAAVHRNLHSGLNLFTCSRCSLSFSREGHLKAHEKSHSSDA